MNDLLFSLCGSHKDWGMGMVQSSLVQSSF